MGLISTDAYLYTRHELEMSKTSNLKRGLLRGLPMCPLDRGLLKLRKNLLTILKHSTVALYYDLVLCARLLGEL